MKESCDKFLNAQTDLENVKSLLIPYNGNKKKSCRF